MKSIKANVKIVKYGDNAGYSVTGEGEARVKTLIAIMPSFKYPLFLNYDVSYEGCGRFGVPYS